MFKITDPPQDSQSQNDELRERHRPFPPFSDMAEDWDHKIVSVLRCYGTTRRAATSLSGRTKIARNGLTAYAAVFGTTIAGDNSAIIFNGGHFRSTMRQFAADQNRVLLCGRTRVDQALRVTNKL